MGLAEPVNLVCVHTYHRSPGRLRAEKWEGAWSLDILAEHMESTLHSEHGESSHDLALHDARARNKRAPVLL